MSWRVQPVATSDFETTPQAVTAAEKTGTEAASFQDSYQSVVLVYKLPTATVKAYAEAYTHGAVTVPTTNAKGKPLKTTRVAITVSENWTDIGTDVDPEFRQQGAWHGELIPLGVELTNANGDPVYLSLEPLAVTNQDAVEEGKALGVTKTLWDQNTFSLNIRHRLLWSSASAYLQNKAFPTDPKNPQSWLSLWGFGKNATEADAAQTASAWADVAWRGLTIPVPLPKTQTLYSWHAGKVTVQTVTLSHGSARLGFWSKRDQIAVRFENADLQNLLIGQRPRVIILSQASATVAKSDSAAALTPVNTPPKNDVIGGCP